MRGEFSVGFGSPDVWLIALCGYRILRMHLWYHMTQEGVIGLLRPNSIANRTYKSIAISYKLNNRLKILYRNAHLSDIWVV